MKNYTITWQKRDKYLPLQRKTVVKASSEPDARAALHREFGTERQIEIMEVVVGE